MLLPVVVMLMCPVITLINCYFVLQVGVHVLAPAAALVADPLPGAIAILPLREAVAATSLPEGAARLAVEIDGTETEQQLAAVKKLDAVVVLLNIKVGRFPLCQLIVIIMLTCTPNPTRTSQYVCCSNCFAE